MEGHIAETEALEARCTCRLLLVVATSSSQIWPNQAGIIVDVIFHKIRQWSVASAEEIHDFVTDRPWYLWNALRDECPASGVASGELM